VHSIWKPVHGRFKDYISMPKANMYQSLHTTVIGPDGERIEIQIRTEEMNRLAEEGVAAHWQYKERGKGRFSPKDIDRFTWLRQIMDWQRELKDSREFMATLRIDLFQDEVYVFTPKGQVKELPEGATPVDFAYMIHSAVGDHCAGAKINGRLSPLSTPLKNGDAVEIITDQNRTPSRDWLKYVKTARARTRIKHWIRTEERARSIVLGKEMLEKQGRKDGVNIQKAVKDGSLRAVAEELSLGGVDELFSAVGYVRVTAKKIIGRLLPARPEMTQPEADAAAAVVASQAKSKSSDAIRIQGVDNVLVRYAQCCNPLPGDSIVGYISRGRGVTIHTHDCPNVQGFEPERLLRVSWEGEEERPYPARMRILAKNIKGVLGKISLLLAEEGVNIDSGAIHSSVDGTTEILFTVEVTDASHLYRTMERISTVDAVIEVKRLAISGPAMEFGKAETDGMDATADV
jgi:GTP pyrophosphokinase